MSYVSTAKASVAEFKKVHGGVDIFHEGERKSIPVAVGAVVNVGDTVRTGKRSRAQLKFADGSVLNIGSFAKIQIGEFSYNADTKVRKSSIRNLRGKVRAAVSKSMHKDSFFRIKTPGAMAAVRGTNFAVDVISPSETIVVTFKGAVAVSNLLSPQKNNSVLVLANQITRVIATRAPTPPVTAPAKVLNNMAAGTKQLENKPATKGTTESEHGKAAGSSNRHGAKGGTKAGKPTNSEGSTTTTKTTGKTTTKGVSITTTTTTTSATGATSAVSTTIDSGNASLPVSTAPIALAIAPAASGITTPTVVVPQTVKPTITQTPVVTVPAPITPPVTTTLPALKKVNVNVVYSF